MDILTKEDFTSDKEKHREILRGAVFIYPTDTIYGIGCNANNSKAVKKIRDIKNRDKKPFSIIAPGKKWIMENCGIKDSNGLSRLPGPYTFILKLEDSEAVSEEVNPGKKTLGVRIPDNWFSMLVKDLGVPIVTTSVNKTGKPYMTSLEDLDEDIKKSVDFIIYEGPKKGKPSTIITFEKGEARFKLR